MSTMGGAKALIKLPVEMATVSARGMAGPASGRHKHKMS